MRLLKKIIFHSGMDIQKNTYIWNMAAGLCSAFESVLFSMIVTRLVGLSDAGIVTIGFAIGNLMATIGKYGVRTFQVTDTEETYLFSDYFRARILTILFMAIASGGYIVYCYYQKGYSFYKTVVVIMLCIKFAVEAFEDVFAGECQKRGRLDASSRIFVFRSLSFVFVFSAILFFSGSVLVALFFALLLVLFIEIFMVWMIITTMELPLLMQGWKAVWDILMKCFPLFLSVFFFFYITNAPKYAIDTVMNDEVQACYGFIAFSVFGIELLNNFIYQPVLVSLASDWNAKAYVKVKSRIYRQLFIILGLTVLAVGAGYICGIPILSMIFSTDLSAYKLEMLILLCSGGLLAVVGYLSTILITMRRSFLLICGYTVAFVISLFSYTAVVIKYYVLGAVLLYTFLCFCFALYEYLAISVIIKNVREENSDPV